MHDDLAQRARLLATQAHAGQVDKSGHPYIEHPRRVAQAVATHGTGAVAVAWLHDVVEDTHITLAGLRHPHGFPESVVRAVDALTHRPHEPRAAYYERVKADPLALVVKLADIADNSDPARLELIGDDSTRDRLRVKYASARQALGTGHPLP